VIRNRKFFGNFELATSQTYRDSRKKECKRSFIVMRMDGNLSLELLFVSGTTKPTHHGMFLSDLDGLPRLIIALINN